MVNPIATAQQHVPQIHIRTCVNQSRLNWPLNLLFPGAEKVWCPEVIFHCNDIQDFCSGTNPPREVYMSVSLLNTVCCIRKGLSIQHLGLAL